MCINVYIRFNAVIDAGLFLIFATLVRYLYDGFRCSILVPPITLGEPYYI